MTASTDARTSGQTLPWFLWGRRAQMKVTARRVSALIVTAVRSWCRAKRLQGSNQPSLRSTTQRCRPRG
jgi:hypothetical protein